MSGRAGMNCQAVRRQIGAGACDRGGECRASDEAVSETRWGGGGARLGSRIWPKRGDGEAVDDGRCGIGPDGARGARRALGARADAREALGRARGARGWRPEWLRVLFR